MKDNSLDSIFKQIDSLKRPETEQISEIIDELNESNNSMRELLHEVSTEIQRVLDENDFTQEDLCKITMMSQSNVSKIMNGKVIPKLDTLQKIAAATNTRLVIGFEGIEEEK